MSHLAFATHDDETTVRALTTHLEHSWNANDGFQYASVFTEDSDYIAFDGTHLKGRRVNAEHHDRLFRSVLAGSRLMFDGVTVRFLAPTVALMHGDGSVMMPWQATIAPSRRSRQTYVVVKESDTWRIAAFQNVRMRPLAVPRGFACCWRSSGCEPRSLHGRCVGTHGHNTHTCQAPRCHEASKKSRDQPPRA